MAYRVVPAYCKAPFSLPLTLTIWAFYFLNMAPTIGLLYMLFPLPGVKNLLAPHIPPLPIELILYISIEESLPLGSFHYSSSL